MKAYTMNYKIIQKLIKAGAGLEIKRYNLMTC